MLTKGDNNHVDDIDLYQGLEWLNQRHIVGKVRGYVCSHFFHCVSSSTKARLAQSDTSLSHSIYTSNSLTFHP
jgi:hypothetical protein